MIYRKKYINLFRTFLEENTAKHIAITGEKNIGKTSFILECEENNIFGKKGDYQHIKAKSGDDLRKESIKDSVKTVIIDVQSGIEFSHIRTFIDSLSSKITVFFTWDGMLDEHDIVSFMLPGVGLREYLEHEGLSISIETLLHGEVDMHRANKVRDDYMSAGSYPSHLLHPEGIYDFYAEKKKALRTELFEKEYEVFDTYLRTIAMQVGKIYKADQIAKLLGISRRKVNKYTDIILSHGLVKSLDPWVQDSEVETSRHTKLYFSELSYPKAILGDIYAEGTLKQGALENLIFLELERKLGSTHALYYYRKKSGAEISFIIEDTETTLITPLEVTTQATTALPQVFRVFDTEYHDRVERYMMTNDRNTEITDLEGKPLIIIPHIGI